MSALTAENDSWLVEQIYQQDIDTPAPYLDAANAENAYRHEITNKIKANNI